MNTYLYILFIFFSYLLYPTSACPKQNRDRFCHLASQTSSQLSHLEASLTSRGSRTIYYNILHLQLTTLDELSGEMTETCHLGGTANSPESLLVTDLERFLIMAKEKIREDKAIKAPSRPQQYKFEGMMTWKTFEAREMFKSQAKGVGC